MRKINDNGVTLVALVVTIIVLMILAGITLTLVLGQNGIIGKAQEAKDASQNADNATSEGLNNLDYAIDSATKIKSQVENYKDNKAIISSTDNTAIKDDEGNIITIPAGFKIASDSPTKQEDGIVIEDKDGNQYVWVPVVNASNYARTDFGASYDGGGGYSKYSEAMPSDEQASVSTYHGYYIGRYEAGDGVSTANKTLRTSGASTTNTLTIKKGQAPYNWVTKDQANTLATGIKTAEGYKAKTKLCSSYAWDTALNFIQNKVPNYATTSPQGNYVDTTFTYTDITGATQTKSLSSNVLTPTGQTTSVCSIYDMGGNEWEWTTEAFNNAYYPCAYRGGSSGSSYASISAAYRSSIDGTTSNSSFSFRVTLYM